MSVHLMGNSERRSLDDLPASLGGVAGWVRDTWRSIGARTAETRRRGRELRVLETLAVGGRKQLLLVSCAGERFLVGTGSDGVGTIVRVRPEAAADENARGALESM